MKIKCNLCNNSLSLENSILTLHNAPNAAQNFSRIKNNSKKINLKIYQCNNCSLVQVKNKQVKYYKNTIRAVAFSKEMIKLRNRQLKKFILKYNLKKKSIIEIGCGDGVHLEILKKHCKTVVGLENSKKKVLTLRKKKFKIINGYISDKKKINKNFDAFICMSFLEHAPNIKSFINGINNCLKDDAYGIIEVPNYEMIEKKKIYFEFILDHLNYFTKSTITNVLNLNGFEVLKCENICDDYILSLIVKKRKPLKKINIKPILKNIYKSFFIFKKKFKLKKIAVWGAGHQALTTIYCSKLDKEINTIIDSAKFKQNKYAPNSSIKIISPKYLKNFDAILVLGGSYSDEIVKILENKKFKGKIAVINNNKFITI